MAAPNPPDGDRLAAVRAALPALDAGIYLNTGSVGPLPAETAAAMAEIADYELRTGRAHPDYWTDTLQRLDEARASVAAVLTADPGDIALTHSTSDGVSLGVWAIDWRAGDRAVSTTLEHPGGVGALYNLRSRLGIDLAFVDVAPERDDDEVLAGFDEAIDERTRAVVLSHVLWASGRVMPLDRIAAIAHERGAIVIVDGAQSAGAMRVELASTGADVYAVPAQKWLLGPEGMGAVAVSPRVRDRLAPSFGGHLAFESSDSSGGAVVGMARSIGWMSMFIGLDWIYERGASMARYAADRLASVPGVGLVTPRDRMTTLVSFRVAGWAPDAVLEELSARVFAVARTVPLLDAVRISVGFYTSHEELDRLIDCVELLAAHTPETVPPRRTLTILTGG